MPRTQKPDFHTKAEFSDSRLLEEVDIDQTDKFE